MSARVLVTRPQPSADATAARLSAMGFEPVLLPLTRIEAVDTPDPASLNPFDAVVLTSANAVRHLPESYEAIVASKPIFAVGERTAAEAIGLGTVAVSGGTARLLVDDIRASLPAPARLLYLAGVERTPGFEQALEDSGYGVETIELYAATAIDHSDEAASAVLGDPGPDAALVYSRRAAQLLGIMAGGARFSHAFGATRFYCISDQAAEPLRRLAPGRVFASDTSDEDGILALLSSHC